MLEKILQGPESPQLKSRPVRARAERSPRAQVSRAAKGASNPDVQRRAINTRRARLDGEPRHPAEIYAG
jgi:hypothetical protein